MKWEIDFLKFILDNFHNDTMTAIMAFITSLGNYGFIWLMTAFIFLLIPKMRKTGLTMSISLVLVFVIVNVIIKPLIDRVRPFELSNEILQSIIIALPKDPSFPSGHTAAAFAAAVAAYCCDKKYGTYMLVLAALIALSRLYFAVHFPTDVIAGIVVGIAIGVVSYEILKKVKKIVDKEANL